MSSREPEWDEQQRAWALALGEYRRRLCPLCGRPLSVCTAAETETRWRVGAPTRCHATTAVERAREPYRESQAKHTSALLFSATLQDPG